MINHEYCDKCGEPRGMDELTHVEGGLLCEDCFHDYLNSDRSVQVYGNEFLDKHESYFLPWVFDGDAWLENDRKLKFMKACWEEYRRCNPEEARHAENDFIRESKPGEFEDFIKEAS